MDAADRMKALVQRARIYLSGRRTDYLMTFGNPIGARVLVDLAKFCRAHETCFDADPRIHAVFEGRREVWLRIQQHLNLTPDQLWALYNQRPENTETE